MSEPRTAGQIAERLLEQALDDARSGTDAIPAATAAVAALRIEAGEVPGDELAELGAFAFGESLTECTCPPELRARGGWSSKCRADHGTAT